MSRYTSRSERDLAKRHLAANLMTELARRSGMAAGGHPMQGPYAGPYAGGYDNDGYGGAEVIVTGVDPNCPQHGYGGGGGYAAYAAGGSYGRGDQVLQQATATANYVGNTVNIENLNVNFGGNQHVEGGKSKGDGRGESGSYGSRDAGGGYSGRERSSSHYEGSHGGSSSVSGRSGSISGRSDSVGGGPSGIRGGTNSGMSGSGYSGMSGGGYSESYYGGGSRSGRGGSRPRSGFGAPPGGAGSQYYSGPTSGGGARGFERVYMHERHFVEGGGGGGAGDRGRSRMRDMFSNGAGLSRKSGRSDLRDLQYANVESYGGGMGYGGGRGISSASTYGGSSMRSGGPAAAGPPPMLDYPESRGRSRSRSIFSRSGSKASSSYGAGGGGPPLIDYGYDPSSTRSKSRSGSVFSSARSRIASEFGGSSGNYGVMTRTGRSRAASEIGSSFSRGTSKARSMFSSGGYSNSRGPPPMDVPNPPSVASSCRGSLYDEDVANFSRARGFAEDYYAPPASYAGSRGSSHRSSSHTRTIYPESSASGRSGSSYASDYSDSTIRGRAPSRASSTDRGTSRSRSKDLANSLRYLSMHGGGSNAGSSRTSPTEPRVAALEAVQRGKTSRVSSRPPLSRAMVRANESGFSRVGSRFGRSSSVSRRSSTSGSSVRYDPYGQTYREV